MPRATAEIIPGVGHLLGMQRPAVINPMVEAFLASVASTLQRARGAPAG